MPHTPAAGSRRGVVLVLFTSWLVLGGAGLDRASGAGPEERRIRGRETIELEGQGLVRDFSAMVSYKPLNTPAAWKSISRGQTIEADQQLNADRSGSAAIEFEDGTQIRMERDSTLTLRKAGDKRVRLQLGAGAVYVLTRGGRRLAFGTPHGEGVGLGSEYEVRVLPDRTIITVFEGAAEIQTTGFTNRLRLDPNEQGTILPGQPPQKQPIRAENVIEWWLYYPGVIDTDELPLAEADRAVLAESIQHYRAGDFLEAYRRLPAPGADSSDGQRLFRAAVELGLGDVARTRQRLAEWRAPHLPLVSALQTLIAAVTRQTGEEPASGTTGSESMALSYWHQARHDLGRAREAAREATERSPNFGFAWARVAELEFGHGRIRSAEAAAARSLQLSPRHAPAQALRGFVLTAENRISEAVKAFETALDLDYRLGDAWLGLGLCRIRRGDLEGGREDLKTAVLVEPNRALLRSYLGKAFGQTKSWFGAGSRAGLATNELGLAMALDPNDPTAWLYRALLERDQNRINPAVADLEKSIERNDNRALYRSRLLLDGDQAVRSSSLADLYQSAGMKDVAVREAARAVTYDYANYSSHLFLSESYNDLRDPTRFNLRYETVWFNEWLLANLLSPVGGTPLSQNISQQEYARLFEHDRIGLSSSTEYRSDGQVREQASQFGNFGNTSWALDLDYQHNNGVRPNNELDRTEWYTTIKHQWTPQNSVLLLLKYQDYHSGDNFQYYNPADARREFQFDEQQKPILVGGYHHEWQPGVHTLLLGGRLENDQSFSDRGAPQTIVFRDTQIVPPPPVTTIDSDQLDVTLQSQLEIYTAEVQQIFENEHHALLVGGRYQGGEFQTRNRMANPAFYTNQFSMPPADIHTVDDFQRLSAYVYETLKLPARVRLTGGLAYETLRFPENFRSPPIQSGVETRERLNPKAAVVWEALPEATFRGAYTRSLGGVSLDESFRLEPTQLAGFSQAFRTLIPESLVGSISAPDHELWGAALDLKFKTRTYAGLHGEFLRSEVHQTVGVFDYLFANPVPNMVPSSLRQRLNYEERAATLTVNQLLADAWAFGVQYSFVRSELESDFPALAQVTPPVASANRAELQRVNLSLLYHHPTGFFAQGESHWYIQRNLGSASSLPNDSFQQLNLLVGYRLPHQRGDVTLGVLNATGQDYRLNPVTPYAELPREAVFYARLRLRF